MADPIKKKSLWNNPASSKKAEGRESRRTIQGNIVTLLLTAVIIAGGFMLPAALYPFLDSYSNRLIPLASLTDDMVTGHVFAETATVYPWNIYDEAQVRALTGYEMITLEQSGIAELVLTNMELRGMQFEDERDEYRQRILSEFRSLEPYDLSEPGCFVLVDADIDLDGMPDISSAVDFSGKIISLLFISDAWPPLALTEPIVVVLEEPDEATADSSKTDDAADTGAVDTPGEATGDSDNTGNTGTDAAAIPTAPPDAQPDYRPLQEEESIWLFSYVMSREALIIGQMEVFSVFRQLDISNEERFGYALINLIAPESDYQEVLPEVEPMTVVATHDLAQVNHLLRVYDFSDGTRLILYINHSTQNCDGFNLGIMPL